MTRVLFVCVQNAGRSQLARALYEQRGGQARSAGSNPAAEVHQAVEEALEEIGAAPTAPRRLTDEDLEWADVVVSLGCGEEIDGALEWNVADPVGMCLEEVRELRAQIEKRVAELP
jgi:protein-tyrosine-phosphatase